MKKSRVWQAIVPGTQNKPQDTLQIRKTPWHGVTKQPPALNRMKKSRVWQAIVPGTQTKPQDTNQENTLARRDETAPAVPLPGPNVTPEPNEKIKSLAGCSRHTKQATPFKSGKHPGKQPPALNRMKKSRVWQAIVPGTQTKPQDTNQENTLARRDETAPAVPLPGPNVTPEPNEKIKSLAGNYSRHTKQATRHPSN